MNGTMVIVVHLYQACKGYILKIHDERYQMLLQCQRKLHLLGHAIQTDRGYMG